MKTKFDSYSVNDIPEGCKRCVRGEKLVLFITGKCSRNCYYCSLSNQRKNIDVIFANEKECKTPEEVVEEAKESNATGAGITGGDPLIFFDRTLEYAKALKSAFKDFHIHIYLPTNLIDEEKIRKLSEGVDEVRIHPSFLQKQNEEIENSMNEDMEKIKIASKFYKRDNLGLEMPSFPEKKKQIIDFITRASSMIGFVNLNELEISDTNFERFTKEYDFNEDTYTVFSSIESGKEILRACEKLGLKMHLCTAETKIKHQYGNRLKIRKALPFAERDKEGMAYYFAIYCKDEAELMEKTEELEKHKKVFYIDKSKNRLILSQSVAEKLLKTRKYKISRVKEYPTYDKIEVEFYPLSI